MTVEDVVVSIIFSDPLSPDALVSQSTSPTHDYTITQFLT